MLCSVSFTFRLRFQRPDTKMYTHTHIILIKIFGCGYIFVEQFRVSSQLIILCQCERLAPHLNIFYPLDLYWIRSLEQKYAYTYTVHMPNGTMTKVVDASAIATTKAWQNYSCAA